MPSFKKFSELPQGTHFQNGDRKFIKLQTKLPSGLSQKNGRVVIHEDGKLSELLDYNSIDYKGVGGQVPHWLQVEIIQAPQDAPQLTFDEKLNKIRADISSLRNLDTEGRWEGHIDSLIAMIEDMDRVS